jgi:hypothetical protein
MWLTAENILMPALSDYISVAMQVITGSKIIIDKLIVT